MLTASEIYYLNGALDGQDIYGINKMNALAESSVRGISPKESLIDKKYLNKDGSINESSFIMINRLKRYKQGKKYIWIDGRVVAYEDKPELITLEKEKEYKLDNLFKAKIVARIIKEKKFLYGDKEVDTKKKIIMKSKMSELLSFIDEDKLLFIREVIDGDVNLYNVYFEDEGNVFKYNIIKETVSFINPKEVRNEIMDLFKIKR